MATSVRILLISESENDANVMLHHLKHAGYLLSNVHFETACPTQAVLQNNGQVASLCVVSATVTEDVAIEMIKNGELDTLVKDELNHLSRLPEQEQYITRLERERQDNLIALQETKAHLNAISEYSYNALCLINESGKIIWVNEAFVKLSGYERQQIYGALSFKNFLAPESREFIETNFLRFTNNEPYEHHYRFYFVRSDGQKRLCEKHVTDYEDQSGKRILALSMVDITDYEQAEAELRLSEEKFSTAFRISPDAININRLEDGMYLNVNEGFSKLTGYSPEEVIGKTSRELNIWVNPQERDRLVLEMHEHGEVRNLEAGFRCKNGEVRIGLMSAKKIEINNEICIITITRDISERIVADQKIHEQLEELRRWYAATLGREERILELKSEVNALLSAGGLPPRYPSAENASPFTHE